MEPFSSLQFHLDNQGKSQIAKLATWSKILGYVNIILGGFNAAVSLPNFLMGNELQITVIPSVMAAGVLIYMGLQLTGASANLRPGLLSAKLTWRCPHNYYYVRTPVFISEFSSLIS